METSKNPTHALIVANAPDFDAEPFADLLRDADLLIAADGGANALHRAGIAPGLVVGDLDSLDEAALAWLEAQGCAVERAPREKDETDLELALLLALERGAATIDVLGSLGGRLDHTLANVAMLGMRELAGRRVRLLDTTQELLALRAGEQLALAGSVGDTVSLLPLSAEAQGITIDGFLYPLHEATLRADRARGVSNVLLRPPGTVALREGALLVIHHFDAGEHQWAAR
jgi:thiamine pyrophosphokinase